MKFTFDFIAVLRSLESFAFLEELLLQALLDLLLLADFEEGGVVAEILRLSAELNIDLIVIGHQQRRGLSALFSHTDESIVHRAPCDVMVLKIDG